MALQIRVSPDALRQGAEEIRGMFNRCDMLNSRIQVLANKLDSAWDGSASQEMVEKLLMLWKTSNAAKEWIEGSAQLLEAIAQQFEQIDNGEAGIIAGRVDFRMLTIVGPNGGVDFSQPIKLSSSSIRVIPDELREVANESRQVISDSDELENQIGQITSRLHESWEGRAYFRFSERLNEVKKFYVNLGELLEEFAQKIVFVADKYEEIDNLFG